MNVIEATRALGHALQQDERYLRYTAAKKANDEDEKLQKDIAEFHTVKQMINMESGKADRDSERLKSLNAELTDLFRAVQENPNMAAFEEARADMDMLLESVNFIITACANVNDPDKVPETPPSSCSAGGCAGCSGCGG